MTRFARADNIQRKKPLDGSEWKELKPTDQKSLRQKDQQSRSSGDINKDRDSKTHRSEHRRLKRITKKLDDKVYNFNNFYI